MVASIRTNWEIIRSHLPSFNAEGVDDRARATLSLIDAPLPDLQPIEPDPRRCPGCGEPFDSKKTPYCGEECQEGARFVRQFRRALAESAILDHQRQIGLGELLWLVLGGGRPRRLELAPLSAIKRAMDRTNGVCEKCGGTATTVDHIGSG